MKPFESPIDVFPSDGVFGCLPRILIGSWTGNSFGFDFSVFRFCVETGTLKLPRGNAVLGDDILGNAKLEPPTPTLRSVALELPDPRFKTGEFTAASGRPGARV
jgi:hypothetical protein